MGRSYLVWSLANMALRDPASKPLYLRTMDQIIDETLRIEKQEGMYFFLMPYAKDGPYVMQPPHSLFLDGEIALMLASRRVVEEKPEYKPLLTERVNAIVERFQKNPRMLLESYPHECWMFDHCVALDAIKTADYLDGTDHSELIRDWIAMAKQKLVDPKSGLLVSSFTTHGAPLAGPEGCWMKILPATNTSAPGRSLAPSRLVLVTHMNGRNLGKAKQILIPARLFRCLTSAPVRVAWHSSVQARFGTTSFLHRSRRRWTLPASHREQAGG
jgi:hypothetical protein